MEQRKLRWGILGCAAIAKRAVIPGIRESQLNELAAIASRDEDKAKETAASEGIPVAYGSYEALLADASIDAVYVPLPNHLHREWTIRAAEAGKHVLCEKPIALDVRETEEMVAACAKHGVKLAEAFMYRHHPRYAMIRDLIAGGEIGQLRGLHGEFTFNGSANHANVRFRKDWGGGSIYDIGVYPINAARHVLGLEPEAVTVQAFFSPEHDDVDMMASGLLEFPGHIGLTFACGMWAAGKNTLEIIGTDGRIEVPSAYVAKPDASANFFVVRGGERREVEVPHVNQYAVQADDFARSVLYGEPQRFEPDDSIRNMRVVDACLESARRRARVSL